MKLEQRIVVAWMRAVLDRLHWTPALWAKEARISPTSLTRAMSDDFDSVSSVRTLHALARAAKIPSVVDFLQWQTQLPDPVESDGKVIAALLERLLPASGAGRPRNLTALSEAVAHGLILAGRDPSIAENEAALRVATDAALARLAKS